MASAADDEAATWELWSSALELVICIVVVGASFMAYDKTKHNTLLYLGLTFICLSVAIDARILGAMVMMAKIVITPLVVK
jgi:hypothetical protein